MKNFLWNKEENTVRGSAVNLVVTLTILGLVVAGAFNSNIAINLEKLATLMIGFFGISFGVWGAKKTVEEINSSRQ